MRRTIAGLITLVAMLLLLWAGARRGQPTGSTGRVEFLTTPVEPLPVEPTPVTATPAHPAEALVQSLLESARRGDVSAYLDTFAGDLRRRLEREVGERG